MTAVERITEDWEAAAGEVNADLVGTASMEAAFYEKTRAAFDGDILQDTEICF